MSVRTDRVVVAVHDGDDPSRWINVDKWQSYEIVQSVWEDCNRFTLNPTPTWDMLKMFRYPGQSLDITCNGFPQIEGIVDRCDARAAPLGKGLVLAGRCHAGLLIDSSAPRTGVAGKTFKQLLQTLLQPWYPKYIAGITTNNAVNFYRMIGKKAKAIEVPTYGSLLPGEAGKQGLTTGGLGVPRVVTKKVATLTAGKNVVGSFRGTPLTVGEIKYTTVWKVKGGKNSPQFRGVDEPHLKRIRGGEKVMDIIKDVAKQVACMCFMAADSWFVVSKPRYKEQTYGKLVFKRKGNIHVRSVTRATSIADRFSMTLAHGKGKKKRGSKGKDARHTYGVADPSPAFWNQDSAGNLREQLYKAAILEARRGAKNAQMLRRLVRTKMEEAAVKALDYRWEVNGHHDPASGLLYAPDACLEVLDEVHGVSGLHYIVDVNKYQRTDGGTYCDLRLIPAWIWLLDSEDMSDADYNVWMRYRILW